MRGRIANSLATRLGISPSSDTASIPTPRTCAASNTALVGQALFDAFFGATCLYLPLGSGRAVQHQFEINSGTTRSQMRTTLFRYFRRRVASPAVVFAVEAYAI